MRHQALFTDKSLWPSVVQHTWKYAVRPKKINAILLHCTRSGSSNTELQEYKGTINWFLSAGNKYKDYAGISNALLGPGRIVEVVPYNMMPRFSSWSSDEHAYSIEIAQAKVGQPLSNETLATLIPFLRALCEDFDIPPIFVESIDNDSAWTGISGHLFTLQGKIQGKSDPDRLAWNTIKNAFTEGIEDVAKIDELSAQVAELAAQVEAQGKLLAGNGIAPKPIVFNGERYVYADTQEPFLLAELVTGQDALDRTRYNSVYLGLTQAQAEIAWIKRQLSASADAALRAGMEGVSAKETLRALRDLINAALEDE